jgi:hypothetical protein
MKIKILTVLLILSVLLISGCGKKSEVIHTSIDETQELKDESGQKVGEVTIKVEADVEVTTDCGGIACFEEKFAECKPATVTSKLMESIIYYYEIIGPKNGLCEVRSKFTANPNPEWVGKEMTCKYDNTQDFEIAVQDMSNCQGPLYSLMTGG